MTACKARSCRSPPPGIWIFGISVRTFRNVQKNVNLPARPPSRRRVFRIRDSGAVACNRHIIVYYKLDVYSAHYTHTHTHSTDSSRSVCSGRGVAFSKLFSLVRAVYGLGLYTIICVVYTEASRLRVPNNNVCVVYVYIRTNAAEWLMACVKEPVQCRI